MRIRAARVVLATLLATLAASAAQQAQLDASSAASGGGQLSLAAGPSSEPLQQAVYGSSVELQGRVTAVSQHHADTAGTSVVNITLSGLPTNYSQAAVACVFIPYNAVKALESAALQREGTTDFTGQQDLLDQWLQLVISLQRTNASLAFMPPANCSSADSCPSGGLYNFTALCGVPPGTQDVVPSVLGLEGDNDDDSQGPLYTVSRGSSMMRMQRISFYSASPMLGPDVGNTSVAIQGGGLQKGVQCVWLNGSAAPQQRLLVNVTDVTADGGSAACASPPWPLQNASSLAVVMQLIWADGAFLEMGNFSYYPTPWISEFAPAAIPRHGASTVTALLGGNYTGMPPDLAAAMEPQLRILAPGVNSSALVLPANWTEDGTALTASVPEDGPPLPAGSYFVLASLNAQDWSSGYQNESVVLEVSGPLVRMSAPYFRLASGQAAANVTLHLSIAPAVSVTATLALEQRTAAGTGQVSLPSDVLSSEEVYWEAGDDGPQIVSLSLPSGDSWNDRALLLSLRSASNADVDQAQATTIVSAAPPTDFQLTFEAAINQVFYPAANASVPVTVTAGRIPAPGAVNYVISPQTPIAQPFLPSVNGSLAGTLQWDPVMNGSSGAIPVPIEWSQVPMEAIYRLGCELLATWNANVTDHEWQPALHIFGVDQGTCPPGTYLKTAPAAGDNSSAALGSKAELGSQVAAAPSAENGHLRDLHLLGPSGQPIELSTQFEPATTVYGAMVSEDVANATLCIDPASEGAGVTVFNGTNDPLQPVDTAATAATATFSSFILGRRLLGLLGAKAGSCGAGQTTYMLPFQLGQNDFDVFINSNTSAAAQAPAPQSYGAKTDAAQAPGNATVRYTLAVVRLADPQHAQLASLNATLPSGQQLAACGPASAAAAPAPQPDPQQQQGLEEAAIANSTGLALATGYGPCSPTEVAALNVSAATTYLNLQPGLRFPNVQGIRVEVNGQVLSQGGNLGADRITDTTSEVQVRNNPAFLPDAIIVGLRPGEPLQVPIVIIAEDGVTSLRYYVAITRQVAPADAPPPPPPLAAAGPADSPLTEILSRLSVDAVSMPGPSAEAGLAPGAAAAVAESESASAAAEALTQPVPSGWPTPPAQAPQCGACVGGWSSTDANASFCTMCGPGSYSPSAFSPACLECPGGTYSSSWGSTHCRHCVEGTYSPSEGGELCLMCPANFTNPTDGSTSCSTPVGPGTDLATRYAVIVSFGVLLNGTALDQVASLVGVNASSEAVLDTLVSSDTAAAFNISLSDVQVTGVEQVSRRVLYVNVSASLPVDVAPGASDEDVRAAVGVRSISADDPINMLVQDPDKFFGRTTKALNVNAESDGKGAQRTLSSPVHRRRLALPWPAILGICLGGLLIVGLSAAVFARRRTRRAYQTVAARLGGLRLPALRRWGLAEREGSGSSAGSVATEPGVASGLPAGARSRSSQPDSRMLRGPHSDAATAV